MRARIAFLLAGIAWLAGAAPSALAQNTNPVAPTQRAAIARDLRCASPVAKLASIQGSVDIRPAGAGLWSAARLDAPLCAGDRVRVGPLSRAALAYANDIYLQLDQNTAITVSVPADAESTWVELIKGALHFITRSRKPFRVITPFFNASVEGTEVYVALDRNGGSATVFEGRLSVANEAGSLALASGESAKVVALEPLTDEETLKKLKAQAPQRVLIARPRDAVAWALYYPPVIDPRARVGEPLDAALNASIEAFRQGRIAQALVRVEEVPAQARDLRYFIYRASLALYVGRVDEAEADLAQALRLNANSSDALALQSIIAIVQSEKEKGLKLAQQAVANEPTSAAAHIALSYAQQAIFKLEPALASAEQATKLDPSNALAHARVAELRLSQGDLTKALEAAKKAADLNPYLARTQSILGFSYLTRIDTKNAKVAFDRAIELDPADPLPRLGKGLAVIREGKLEEGRREIELATILDPNNSLIRSYMGKAYFEEKRDELAGEQLAIAKQLDPNDPTPWFYDAIRKQTENRPVEALQDLEESIELNDNRGVYRSKLLIDQDLAARSVSQSEFYSRLGFDKLAQLEAYHALAIDPLNYSAHRVLADLFGNRPRHEIARVSEALAAQMWQPLNIRPLDPSALDQEPGVLVGIGPENTGQNEFNSLFVRNGAHAQLTAVGGGNSTFGDQALISGLRDKWSLAVGQFHYESDGFRDNAQLEKDLLTVHGQTQLSDRLSLQAELRYLDSSQGDLAYRFDPDFFFPQALSARSDSVRVAGTYRARPDSAFVGSIYLQDRKDKTDFPTGTNIFSQRARFGLAEIQHVRKLPPLSVVAGASHLLGDIKVDEVGSISENSPRSSSGYVYTYSDLLSGRLNLQLGVSYQHEKGAGAPGGVNQTNHKLGLIWTPTPSTRLRLASFRIAQFAMFGEETVEPTQLAGFNQLFDDFAGTDARRSCIGIDHGFSTRLKLVGETCERRLKIPDQFGISGLFKWKEEEAEVGVYWAASKSLALNAQYRYENFSRAPDFPGVELFFDVRTTQIPLTANLFLGQSVDARITHTYVKQRGTFLNFGGVFDGDDSFWITDVALKLRLPRRLGFFSFEARNLFDTKFNFQEVNFATPSLARGRLILGRVSLAF